MTPEVTASVSLSTPRSEAPSIYSLTSIPTEVPEEDVPSRILRLLQDMDDARGLDNKNLNDRLKHIDDELRDMADTLRKPKVPTTERAVSVAPRSPPPDLLLPGPLLPEG